MNTLDVKQKQVLTASKQLPNAFFFVIRFAILLAGYQILSKEELVKAGIDVDGYRSE